MTVATLTSKGRTAIPKQVRDYLKLRPGDKLDFVIESDGRVVIKPATLDVRNLKGFLKRRDGKELSIEKMNATIARAATGKR
ncbi:MAG: type II toxin-antitoxin system PrlF family antitoxin [Betaproteobacteria bacterium]|nr:type II toxin-antitoxin system PrlF family antitoxin [Betaproteobacteria bacterium]